MPDGTTSGDGGEVVPQARALGLPPMSLGTRFFFWAMERYRGWIMVGLVTPASFIADTYMVVRDWVYRSALSLSSVTGYLDLGCVDHAPQPTRVRADVWSAPQVSEPAHVRARCRKYLMDPAQHDARVRYVYPPQELSAPAVPVPVTLLNWTHAR